MRPVSDLEPALGHEHHVTQQPISAIVQASPRRKGRSFTVSRSPPARLSTNDNTASARGRNSAMTSSCILRNRAEWRTRGARHETAANAQLSGPAVTTGTTKP